MCPPTGTCPAQSLQARRRAPDAFGGVAVPPLLPRPLLLPLPAVAAAPAAPVLLHRRRLVGCLLSRARLQTMYALT